MSNQLDNLLHSYEVANAKLLFHKAQALLQLISDEELELLFIKYPQLFNKEIDSKMESQTVSSKELSEIIRIFIRIIRERHLSKDEFDIMTLDDIKEYINKQITEKSDNLYTVIGIIENDCRTS